MNEERLRRMIRLLRSPLPEGQRFSLQWFSRRVPCGTVKCAIGWAASDPWFQEQGPSLDIFGQPTYRRYHQALAIAHFFDIREIEAERLFYPYYYRGQSATRNAVIARIRHFITTKHLQEPAR